MPVIVLFSFHKDLSLTREEEKNNGVSFYPAFY